MSGHPWYKRYGADFVHGTLGLTLEEKGAYSLCLDLIYDRGGPIPDDARWLAGVCGVSLRKWTSLRDRLIQTGKLVASPGHLSNTRAEREIEIAAKTARKHAESGAKGGYKRAENEAASSKNNSLDEAGLKHRARDQIPEPEKNISLPSEARPTAEVNEIALAVEIFNRFASLAEWPLVQRLTDPRRASLRKRLAECGGLTGWENAMARARGSPFLTGDNDRGWRPNLDFFLQAKSFTKLLEGAYDARTPAPGRGSNQSARSGGGHDALFAAVAGRVLGGDEAGASDDHSGGHGAVRDSAGVYRLSDRRT